MDKQAGFDDKDLLVTQYDLQIINAAYHEETKCWICWDIDQKCHIYLQNTCMDSYQPYPLLDTVQISGYFLQGIHNNTIYVYDWSNWSLVFKHQYKDSIIRHGMCHNSVYVLTSNDDLYKEDEVIERNITNLSCDKNHIFYSSYDRLFSKHSDTEANHILALYHDDKNVYALRNKNTLDAWNHSLHAKTTWIIPSDLTIQKICMIKSILVIQSLDNLLIMNDRQEMIFNKAYGMTTCLSLSMPYLFVAARRLDILDLKRAATCYELQRHYVRMKKLYKCYARILIQRLDQWFRNAAVQINLISTCRPLFRLYIYQHCQYAIKYATLEHLKDILDAVDRKEFAASEILRWCTWYCRQHMENDDAPIVPVLVFLFEKASYYPNHIVWTYCLRHASSCRYWFSLVLSQKRSHLLLRNLVKCKDIAKIFMSIHIDKVLETCRYGTMWFWLQAISDFHSNHCYSHQDTIHKLRHGMVDYILSHPFEEYGTYRKASYHEITPSLCGQRIRYKGNLGLVQHVDISPERERKIVWDGDNPLPDPIPKDIEFECFQCHRKLISNSIEAAIHLLHTDRYWNFKSEWRKHANCPCILYQDVKECKTQKIKRIFRKDQMNDKRFEDHYLVKKPKVKYRLDFDMTIQLLHHIIDYLTDHPECKMDKEYKDALFELLSLYSSMFVEYERGETTCMFLSRLGNTMFLANEHHVVSENGKAIHAHESEVCDMLSLGSTFVSASIDGVLKISRESQSQQREIHTTPGPMMLRWFRKTLIWVLHRNTFIAEYDLKAACMTRSFDLILENDIIDFQSVSEKAYILTSKEIIVLQASGNIHRIIVPNVTWTTIGFRDFFHPCFATDKGHIYNMENYKCTAMPLIHNRSIKHLGCIHRLFVIVDDDEITLYQKEEELARFDLFPEKIIRFQYDMYGRFVIAFKKRRMSIYCENLTQLKSLQFLLNAMRVDEFYDYIHTNQKQFLTRMASTLDEEDAIQLIYESTRKYDARRIWCMPWVFTLCNQTRAPVQEIILQRLVTYTGPQFKACSICFDHLPGQEIVKLSCGHLFHQKCIQEYFDSIPSYQTHIMRQYALHVQTACPNCRQPCQGYVKDDFWSLQNNSI